MDKSSRRERDADGVAKGWAMSKPHRVSNARFVRTLLKYSKLYCRYTKLAGFRYFVEPEATWFDRTLWFLVYAVTVPAMVYTIYYGYLEFMENPIFTSVETEYFPTYQLDFPGIAICSINRISRRAAVELANEVFAANITDLSIDDILSMISQLGDLYDSEFIQQKRFHRIDQLLTVYYNGYYSITDLMKRLTPRCSSMLLKCRFHNEKRNCSDIFAFRKTQDGFCCTFNYATKGDDTLLDNGVNHRLDSMKVNNLTEDGGLSVLLEPFLDDYFYPIFPSPGWKVTIFNPYDYPDMASGGVIDFLVSPREHRRVEIEAIMFNSTKSITAYPLEKRGCVFEDEMTSLRMFYTYSDCIVDCKTADIWKSCGCVPFFLPNRRPASGPMGGPFPHGSCSQLLLLKYSQCCGSDRRGERERKGCVLFWDLLINSSVRLPSIPLYIEKSVICIYENRRIQGTCEKFCPLRFPLVVGV
ncbi:PREDICTED: sodium channel protein Nach-like [Eufriesea mexicana]|uniref:sodium channel protein Nach-like n=1 Tax=Eufriesea mexicana TaxID=516756 RepID=UPI00083C5A2E|nr:PREDICTED: sodium channel protein Nach-like [Eufriesea mexicana]